jgi:hypothetical protein
MIFITNQEIKKILNLFTKSKMISYLWSYTSYLYDNEIEPSPRQTHLKHECVKQIRITEGNLKLNRIKPMKAPLPVWINKITYKNRKQGKTKRDPPKVGELGKDIVL